MLRRLAPRLGEHRRGEVDPGDPMTAGRELEAQKAGAAAGVERVERTAPREHEIEDAIPGGALGGRADAVAKAVVEPRRPPAPMGGDLLFDEISLARTHTTAPLRETDDRSQRFELFGIARDGVEKEMVGAHRDQFLEPLAHLLRRAVDARGVGAFRVVVDLGEPAVELGARDLGAFVHRHEHALRGREGRRIVVRLFPAPL